MKKVIGVVPKGILFDQEKAATSDLYHLGNNYIKRVTEAGGIAVLAHPGFYNNFELLDEATLH